MVCISPKGLSRASAANAAPQYMVLYNQEGGMYTKYHCTCGYSARFGMVCRHYWAAVTQLTNTCAIGLWLFNQHWLQENCTGPWPVLNRSKNVFTMDMPERPLLLPTRSSQFLSLNEDAPCFQDDPEEAAEYAWNARQLATIETEFKQWHKSIDLQSATRAREAFKTFVQSWVAGEEERNNPKPKPLVVAPPLRRKWDKRPSIAAGIPKAKAKAKAKAKPKAKPSAKNYVQNFPMPQHSPQSSNYAPPPTPLAPTTFQTPPPQSATCTGITAFQQYDPDTYRQLMTITQPLLSPEPNPNLDYDPQD